MKMISIAIIVYRTASRKSVTSAPGPPDIEREIETIIATIPKTKIVIMSSDSKEAFRIHGGKDTEGKWNELKKDCVVEERKETELGVPDEVVWGVNTAKEGAVVLDIPRIDSYLSFHAGGIIRGLIETGLVLNLPYNQAVKKMQIIINGIPIAGIMKDRAMPKMKMVISERTKHPFIP